MRHNQLHLIPYLCGFLYIGFSFAIPQNNTYQEYQYVDFYTSMGKYNPLYSRWYQKYVTEVTASSDVNTLTTFSFDRGTYPLTPAAFLERLNATYEQYNPASLAASKNLKKINSIPKVIHQIWLGSKFPERYREIADSWKKHNPTWQYYLWTDETVKSLTLINQDLYDKTNNWGEKSDILRFEILYQLGGLYVDTDFECVRSFDCIHELYDFYIGMAPLDSGPIYTGIGLVAAAPQHPICKHYLENLDKFKNLKEVYMRTGPIPFSQAVVQKFGILQDIVFPATYFYPLGLTEKTNNEKIKNLKHAYPEHFAIHHWHASWK